MTHFGHQCGDIYHALKIGYSWRRLSDDGTAVTVANEDNGSVEIGRRFNDHSCIGGEIASRVDPNLPAGKINRSPCNASTIEFGA